MEKVKILYDCLIWICDVLENLQENLKFVHNDLKADNIFFKLVQIEKYNWIDEKQINKCIQNMDNKVIQNLEYEKIITYNYNSNKYGELNIIGRIK
jgi:hypothetical protein